MNHSTLPDRRGSNSFLYVSPSLYLSSVSENVTYHKHSTLDLQRRSSVWPKKQLHLKRKRKRKRRKEKESVLEGSTQKLRCIKYLSSRTDLSNAQGNPAHAAGPEHFSRSIRVEVIAAGASTQNLRKGDRLYQPMLMTLSQVNVLFLRASSFILLYSSS